MCDELHHFEDKVDFSERILPGDSDVNKPHTTTVTCSITCDTSQCFTCDMCDELHHFENQVDFSEPILPVNFTCDTSQWSLPQRRPFPPSRIGRNRHIVILCGGGPIKKSSCMGNWNAFVSLKDMGKQAFCVDDFWKRHLARGLGFRSLPHRIFFPPYVFLS